jgi:hypothetical protein
MDGIDFISYKKKFMDKSSEKWRHYFTQIPNKVILDDKINKNGLLVFVVLRMRQFKGKTSCFPSMQTIQKEARLSPNSVRNGISNLIENHYLDIKRCPGRINTYFLYNNGIWKDIKNGEGGMGVNIQNRTLDR